MKPPTPEQIEARAPVSVPGETAFATWYPQMGGYVGKCVVSWEAGDREWPHCFAASVWHDGDFPFEDGRDPATLHHCDPLQFVRFGVEVLERQAGEGAAEVDAAAAIRALAARLEAVARRAEEDKP